MKTFQILRTLICGSRNESPFNNCATRNYLWVRNNSKHRTFGRKFCDHCVLVHFSSMCFSFIPSLNVEPYSRVYLCIDTLSHAGLTEANQNATRNRATVDKRLSKR